jgi:hypothetical protein
MLKRIVGITAAVALVAGLVGVAAAQMGPGFGPGMGPGMGRTGMTGGCPGIAGQATATVVTEEQAKQAAETYVGQYLKGFTIERVLPSTGMRHTMYVVELKGPNGEARTLHVNPWGGVRPFGPLALAR